MTAMLMGGLEGGGRKGEEDGLTIFKKTLNVNTPSSGIHVCGKLLHLGCVLSFPGLL